MENSFLTLDLRWNSLTSIKIVKCAHKMYVMPKVETRDVIGGPALVWVGSVST